MGRAWPRSVSSEAEKPHVEKKVSTPEHQSPALLEDLGRFKGMFQEGDSEKDSSDSEGLALQKVSRKHQPPGGVSSSSRELPFVQKKSSRKNASHHYMMQTLSGKGISEGKSPADLMPYLMMSFMMDQRSKGSKKSRRERRGSWLQL